LNPSRRIGDKKIEELITDMVSNRSWKETQLPLPSVYVTVRNEQLGRVQLKASPNSFDWFAAQGVKNMPTMGKPLLQVLEKTGLDVQGERLAFPLSSVKCSGVVAVTDLNTDWHISASDVIRGPDMLVNLSNEITLLRAPAESK
jgi:hypothetical protein